MDFQNYIDSRILFSVPIYFRSQEEHRNYFNKKRQAYVEEQERLHRQYSDKIKTEDKIGWELAFERFFFHGWQYTEIIGYIEFRKKETSIFAFVFHPEAQRFGPLMNQKRFIISRYFPDYEIEIAELTNEQIVEEINNIISQIGNSSPRFRRYHIDKSEIGNYVHLIDYKNF